MTIFLVTFKIKKSLTKIYISYWLKEKSRIFLLNFKIISFFLIPKLFKKIKNKIFKFSSF